MKRVLLITILIFSISCKERVSKQTVTKESSKIDVKKQIKKIIDFDYNKSAYYKSVSQKDFSLPNIIRKEVRITISEGF